ncbi:hypothetical protein MANES_07G095608v8 [Manihot esculenta]|uniref:Uncharacterized protein n=1 Tax=Manihot esculenta TaxID=3983 RepID=A0ACB7HEQ2_MANES|nr:hypothetical protein MANES_07G095608v8 [Manihot esculenta]
MTILRLKGNFCVCKGHEKRITKVLSKNKGLWIKNLDLENGLIHIEGDIEIEKLVNELQKKFKSMQVEIVGDIDSDEETDSDKCELVTQPILTLENGVGQSVPRLEWPDVVGQSGLGLRPHGGLTQSGYDGYGGFGTTSTYSYGGQNYQISNYPYFNIRDENPNACSTM